MKVFVLPLSLLLLSGCGGGKPKAPPPAATADGAVMQVIESLKEDDPSGFWHMLPESYQNEANGLVHQLADQVPADLYNDSMALIVKMEKVLRTKKDLILANPMASQAPGDVHSNYDQGLEGFKALTSSDLMTHDGLENLDIGTFLSTTGAELMALNKDMARILPARDVNDLITYVDQLNSAKVELVSEDGDQAVVRLTADGKDPQKIDFTKVEGKWIPAEIANEWDKMVSESKAGISQMTITPEMEAQVSDMIKKVDGVLDQLLVAETQADIEQALAPVLGLIMGMAAGGAGGF